MSMIKRYRHIILIVILFISIALNYFLFNQGKWYYTQLNWVRLDPLGLERFPAKINLPPDYEKMRVVFYGDSRAANWSSPKIENFEFINRGIGAQTSAQVLHRFEHHLQPLNPEIVIVQVGINDLKSIPLFPDQKVDIVNDLQNNIEKLVQKSTSLDSYIIMTTVFPIGKVPLERRVFWSDDVDSAIHEVNEFIYSLESAEVVIFDSFAILVGEDGLIQPQYSQDFLHVNRLGYDKLNEELSEVIKSLKMESR